MAIDIAKERLLTLSQAAKKLPKRRAGKPTATSTLYRWASVGLRGVKLVVLRVGGCTCTSDEALQRFFDRLTEVANSSKSAPRADASSITAAPDQVEQLLDRAKL